MRPQPARTAGGAQNPRFIPVYLPQYPLSKCTAVCNSEVEHATKWQALGHIELCKVTGNTNGVASEATSAPIYEPWSKRLTHTGQYKGPAHPRDRNNACLLPFGRVLTIAHMSQSQNSFKGVVLDPSYERATWSL